MADYRLADHPPARVDPSEESTFMSRVRVWPLVLITAFAVGLAACGSSSPGASTTPSTKATTATTAGAQPPARTGASTIAPIPTQDLSPAGKAGTAPTLIVPPGAPPTQLESANLLTGTGAVATVGAKVTVEYVLATYSSRKVIQSSWTSQALQITLANGQVIPGWVKGVPGMRVGGRRELIIPPSLAYGSQSPGTGIAPNDTLLFIVDLQKID
jgi:peptidylprolyl isomerase